jgi:hypothetical protein
LRLRRKRRACPNDRRAATRSSIGSRKTRERDLSALPGGARQRSAKRGTAPAKSLGSKRRNAP